MVGAQGTHAPGHSKVMTSQKYIFRMFEFGSHNLKEHHEIPLNVQNQSSVLQIGRDVATCALALSPTNICIFVSVHNFYEQSQNNSDLLANL